MALSKEQLENLYNKYLQNQCTPQELQTLIEALGAAPASQHEEQIFRLFDKTWEGLEMFPDKYNLPEIRLPDDKNNETPVIAIQLPKTRWWRIAAAASILLLISLGTYLWFTASPPHRQLASADLAPGGNKAVLILGDGKTIVLDSIANGKLAQQGESVVKKAKDGELIYEQAGQRTQNGDASTIVTFNTLRTPRGGQYQLLLPDGSKVWLNAASSIRYPTSFTGPERKVSITGEAYLEIAKNVIQPFIVQVGSPAGSKGEVMVLGTRFNINSYDDEPVVKTTLLEGVVQVKKDASTAILKPGQQSQLTMKGQLNVVNDADLDETLAWKDGQFSFKNADLKTIMRQVARWYDVDMEYEYDVQERFYLELNRNTNVSNVFRILETTGGAHFKVDGKKIIVMK